MNEENTYCRNCGSGLNGPYCSQCGQKDQDIHLPVKELASELIEIFPSFEKRLFNTLRPFLASPGTLTLEYLSGKRKRYLSPFKLYFFISFIYFLTSSLTDSGRSFVNIHEGNKNAAQRNQPKDTVQIVPGADKNAGFEVSLRDSSDSSGTIGNIVSKGLNRMRSNPSLMIDKFKEYRPKIIFLLLPFFALLLKLFYIRSQHLYIKHLVFTFYFHSFVFFVMLSIDLLEFTHIAVVSDIAGLFYFAIPVYLSYGLKRVYRQSRWKTLIKLSLLSVSYMTIFLFIIITALSIIIYTFY